jgi:hypothetical protein
MGKKRRRSANFLDRNPICIFCGGTTPATTRDHVPSRQLFYRREWPEGYEFPSCRSCNSATRHEEQVIAMFSRIYPDGRTEVERSETKKIIESVSRHYPEVLSEMRSSPRQVRNFLKKSGRPLPAGKTTQELPYVNASGPNLHWCMSAFARKLFAALHFKNTGMIIPRCGGIAWMWYANTQFIDGEVPEEIFRHFGQGWQRLHRRKVDLGEQFNYSMIGPSDDGQVAGYLAAFRFSFAIFGFVCMDIKNFDLTIEKADLLRPLSWDQAHNQPKIGRLGRFTAGT